MKTIIMLCAFISQSLVISGVFRGAFSEMKNKIKVIN